MREPSSDVTGSALHPESVLIDGGRPFRTAGSPVNQPIAVSATFHADGAHAYGREGSDTTRAFESVVGAVEGGAALAFSSGVAATAALVEGLPTGSVLVVPRSFYNFHDTVFAEQESLGRLTVRRVDTADPEAVRAALPGAAVLWLELPTNPMLRVADLPRLSAAARAVGAITVVDSTVATPLNLQPLRHGADVVMHSATKWIAGHSDALMGLLVTNSGELAARFVHRRELTGAVPGTLEAFLALRGLRTLSVRLERAQANATELARRLSRHPQVARVHYPGLTGHPDADRIRALLGGPGALLSFEFAGTAAEAEKVCQQVRLITHGTSIGGVESLIERRARYAGERRQHTPESLIRLSVGIEHVEDLWADLEQALASSATITAGSN
jgi:cystathionine gamma-synthase